MSAPAKRDILAEVDELDLELMELRGMLHVCRAAAAEPGDAPDNALPDALSGAVRALATIEERARRIGAFALAASDGCVLDTTG
jgi:hypothetical protein